MEDRKRVRSRQLRTAVKVQSSSWDAREAGKHSCASKMPMVLNSGARTRLPSGSVSFGLVLSNMRSSSRQTSIASSGWTPCKYFRKAFFASFAVYSVMPPTETTSPATIACLYASQLRSGTRASKMAALRSQRSAASPTTASWQVPSPPILSSALATVLLAAIPLRDSRSVTMCAGGQAYSESAPTPSAETSGAVRAVSCCKLPES
mmetsp:Transcript_159340/g.297186  ORF Transcript_159340/g.297186 Transcript_159340/m.297186 type:complete len:206 (+) Transcript_159340:120-737(+)